MCVCVFILRVFFRGFSRWTGWLVLLVILWFFLVFSQGFLGGIKGFSLCFRFFLMVQLHRWFFYVFLTDLTVQVVLRQQHLCIPSCQQAWKVCSFCQLNVCISFCRYTDCILVILCQFFLIHSCLQLSIATTSRLQWHVMSSKFLVQALQWLNCILL